MTGRTRSRLALLLVIAAAGCRGEPEPEVPPPVPAASATPEMPPHWRGRTNPLPSDAPTIERGRAVFARNCATCHGAEADGKGVASAGLNPPPANFRDGKRLSYKGDDFLFWRVSTGITGTAMPAFEATLSEEDRWAALRFLRSLSGAEARPTPSPERT